MKTILYFLLPLCLGILISCQETDDDLGPTHPSTGCDGDLTGTDCQQFFVAAGETLSYSTGTEIKASEGIEINGDIIIDPANEGNFTITATSGDIVIAGKILIKDTASGNPFGGRYKSGKSSSRLKNGKAADGFTLTLDARGPNGNIILKKGATLFSGRGQHAPDENLTALAGYHEGAAGGNGGLIILNAPNGKVILPNVGNTVTPFQDEVFVLGNGGNGASIELDANLEVGNLDVLEVRGGLGGNSGELIIDALNIEGVPPLETMDTHPDFIYGGEGGWGGYVKWDFAGKNKKYSLTEIVLHGGDGGNAARHGGKGGFAYFSPVIISIENLGPKAFSEVGDPVANTFCYGGDGGDVFASAIPVSTVYGGDGGEYSAHGVRGWEGDEEMIHGADGGNALGQGGNGGDILEGVRAYEAFGGSGGHSEEARTSFLLVESDYLEKSLGVTGGYGGNGYSECEGCPGGNGGNAGTATAIGGKGGDVLGLAYASFGGKGGDTWAFSRGKPGNGGNGNDPGSAGKQQPVFLSAKPGDGGDGLVPGIPGDVLGDDLNSELGAEDGQYCGEDLECENEPPCWEQIGSHSSFTTSYIGESVETFTGSDHIKQNFVSKTIEGHLIDFDQARNVYVWEITVTYQDRVSADGEVLEDTTIVWTETHERPPWDGTFWTNPVPCDGDGCEPRCLGGELYFPGSNFTYTTHREVEDREGNIRSVIDATETFSYGGCHALGDFSDWFCCPNESGGLLINFRRGQECP